jgi:hypothetical protein
MIDWRADSGRESPQMQTFLIVATFIVLLYFAVRLTLRHYFPRDS